jgi:RNA polymerase sigma factor (sigma-70 family)
MPPSRSTHTRLPSSGRAVRIVQPLLSYEELHRGQAGRVRRLCRLLLADPDEAEEVAQEVFLKLFRARERTAPTTWDRWVARVAINACRDRLRSRWWRRWGRGWPALDEEGFAAAGKTPEEAVAALEERRRIWAAFRKLPRRQREVFLLRHVEGWSTAEVAATLGLAEGSAKRHLFRAVRHLRRELGGEP